MSEVNWEREIEHGFWHSKWFNILEMSIDQLEAFASIAREKGYNRWATWTDKSQEVWATEFVMWREEPNDPAFLYRPATERLRNVIR